MDTGLRDIGSRALEQMRARGFDQSQATATETRQDELCIEDGAPNMLRSTHSRRLNLVGIADGRRAATEVSDLREEAVRDCIAALRATVEAAPRDAANRVSSGERANIVQGPQESDVALLTRKAAEMLELFAQRPKVRIREAIAAHTLVRSHTLTSGGTDMQSQVGHHTLSTFAVAREGEKISSFQVAGGECHEVDRHASEYFGIDEMLRDLERQIDARPMGAKFTGDVVLTPPAVADLVNWLLGQLCDEQLIAGTSLYRDQVGQAIASPLLSMRSRFDAPGIAAISADGFAARPVEILRNGVLASLTPSLYGSLKTGLPHVPTVPAPRGGWDLAAGDTPRAELIAGTQRGAIVGRFSMGRPASNGDFAGVIKNSFAIEGGKLGTALSETMVCGNVASMLRDVIAVSRERLDTGAYLLPWVRIGGLHFS